VMMIYKSDTESYRRRGLTETKTAMAISLHILSAFAASLMLMMM